MSLIVKESIVKLRNNRLHLYQQNDSKNWFWRTFLNGKYLVRSTKTQDFPLAKLTAEEQYDKLRANSITEEGTPAHSWEECEQGLLNSLSHDEDIHPSRLKNYKTKLNVLRKYFGTTSVHSIKTKTIEEYLAWRRHTYKPKFNNYHSNLVANKTLRSDLLVLRQILKYARREDFIKMIPDFPRVSVRPRPAGWFTPREMLKLLRYKPQWLAEAGSPEERHKREYTYLYIYWLVFTGMRVDETLQVRFEDVEISRANPNKKTETDCLYINVKGGKLSYLKGATEMIGLPEVLGAFQRLQQLNNNPNPKDLIFPTNPRDTLRQLLETVGLLVDERGEHRTAKSFRHTYIMSRLLHGVDVYDLAQNCRTDVRMIQQHYGSYLNARMKREALMKMLPRKNEKGIPT